MFSKGTVLNYLEVSIVKMYALNQLIPEYLNVFTNVDSKVQLFFSCRNIVIVHRMYTFAQNRYTLMIAWLPVK